MVDRSARCTERSTTIRVLCGAVGRTEAEDEYTAMKGAKQLHSRSRTVNVSIIPAMKSANCLASSSSAAVIVECAHTASKFNFLEEAWSAAAKTRGHGAKSKNHLCFVTLFP